MNLKYVLVGLLLAGCQNATASKGDVLLLGDEARLSLSRATGADTPAKIASASEVANLATRAKHAVLVVDAAHGPLPVTREHILIARQARVPSMSVLVVNTAALNGLPDKSALIDGEVAEVRQLFDKYDIKGEAIPVIFDEGGLTSILDESAALPPRAPATIAAAPRQDFSGFVYLLSVPESPGTNAVSHGDTVTAWIGGQTVRATVQSKAAIEPGGVGDMELRTDAPISVGAGQRFLFEKAGKIVAAGIVTK